jgi:hypothetical protein
MKTFVRTAEHIESTRNKSVLLVFAVNSEGASMECPWRSSRDNVVSGRGEIRERHAEK